MASRIDEYTATTTPTSLNPITTSSTNFIVPTPLASTPPTSLSSSLGEESHLTGEKDKPTPKKNKGVLARFKGSKKDKDKEKEKDKDKGTRHYVHHTSHLP